MRVRRNPGSGGGGAPDAEGITPAKRKLRRGLGNRSRPEDADLLAHAERVRRRRLVFERKTMGATTAMISAELGISFRQVQKDFQRAVDDLGAEENVRLRAVANAQLDQDLIRLHSAMGQFTKILEKKADKGASNALAELVRAKTKIIEAKAKINGAIVPVRREVHVTHEVSGAIGVVLAGMSEERFAQYVERGRERQRLAEAGSNVRVLRDYGPTRP